MKKAQRRNDSRVRAAASRRTIVAAHFIPWQRETRHANRSCARVLRNTPRAPGAGSQWLLIQQNRERALDSKTWNHPALADGKLLIRNDRKMMCFDLTAPP